jgi:hypothetical protein
VAKELKALSARFPELNIIFKGSYDEFMSFCYDKVTE